MNNPNPSPDVKGLPTYDAGLLGDGGGGDVGWWQDYIRAELTRAHEFYEDHVSDLLSTLTERGNAQSIRREAMEEEREACARIAEKRYAGKTIATAIRQRSNGGGE